MALTLGSQSSGPPPLIFIIVSALQAGFVLTVAALPTKSKEASVLSRDAPTTGATSSQNDLHPAPALLRRAAAVNEAGAHADAAALQDDRLRGHGAVDVESTSLVTHSSWISCGGHAAIRCADCPDWGGYATDRGPLWCNGDCKWDLEHSECVWRGPQHEDLHGLQNPLMTAYDNMTINYAADAAVRERAVEADERQRVDGEEEARRRDTGLTRRLQIFVCWSVGTGVFAVLTVFGTMVYFLFGKPKVKAKAVRKKKEAKDEYMVIIKKTLGAKLGLDITLKADSMLINKVTGGLAQEWNDKYPTIQIQPGDEVVEVNDVKGKGGNGKKLLEECAKNQELTLRFVRYMKQDEDPDVADKDEDERDPSF